MKRIWRVAMLLVVLALVAAACGNDDETGGATTTGSGGGELTGNIEVSGSSTVEPITDRVAEAFSGANPGVGVRVEGPGTGDGFRRFCAGETDISNASRAIKDSEIELCTAAGIEYIELKVGLDGLSVLTSPANTAVSCLSFTDLYALLGPESLGFGDWSAASDLGAELGAENAPYPDAPLVVTAPGEESGTYDFFLEAVIEPIAEERGLPEEEWAVRPDYTAAANDNTIITGIAGSDTSLGWVGFAFFEENVDKVKALEVDGGDGCVAPTLETIASGEYPISRPLFIYVNKQKAAEKPELAAFVDYYLSDEGLKAVTDAGYVALEDYSEARAAWAGR